MYNEGVIYVNIINYNKKYIPTNIMTLRRFLTKGTEDKRTVKTIKSREIKGLRERKSKREREKQQLELTMEVKEQK